MVAQRVFVLGATGTIGRATVRACVEAGHDVVAFVRPRADAAGVETALAGATVRWGMAGDAQSLARDGFAGEAFDAVVSCMASRTGAPRDAWRVDHDAHQVVLSAAKDAGVPRMVLLSALCVQRPMLAFQRAKLAFEDALISSGLSYSIVRPTAFFKSLSGQIGRVQAGKPFLVFGDGRLTACKPISDRDLAAFIVSCLSDSARTNCILPVGGPGEATTPLDQGMMLFRLLGAKPRFRKVPPAMLQAIAGGLSVAGHLVPRLGEKAELARIGHYYATQSMLVFDPVAQRYDAAATPSFGSDTLKDHFRAVLTGKATVERGDHAVF